MGHDDQRTVQTVVTCATIGGFAFMALVGWVLAFNVSSIATMIAGAAEQDLLSALMLGGSLTKGVTFGIALGLVLTARKRRAQKTVPAMTAAPAL
jgi:hypothetical protein